MLEIRIIRIILFLLFASVLAERKCNFSDLSTMQCPFWEVCEDTGKCNCLPGYVRKNGTSCVLMVHSVSESNYSSLVDNQGSGSIVAGILTPLFLIVFVMCGVYIARKYQLMAWFRNKLNRRNVNYDEFMIGQDLDDDDPPLH